MFSWAFDLYHFVYVNESDPRSNVHYLGSSENKACTRLEPMTSAIPVQCKHITARITLIHVFIRTSNIWLSYILNRLFTTLCT